MSIQRSTSPDDKIAQLLGTTAAVPVDAETLRRIKIQLQMHKGAYRQYYKRFGAWKRRPPEKPLPVDRDRVRSLESSIDEALGELDHIKGAIANGIRVAFPSTTWLRVWSALVPYLNDAEWRTAAPRLPKDDTELVAQVHRVFDALMAFRERVRSLEPELPLENGPVDPDGFVWNGKRCSGFRKVEMRLMHSIWAGQKHIAAVADLIPAIWNESFNGRQCYQRALSNLNRKLRRIGAEAITMNGMACFRNFAGE